MENLSSMILPPQEKRIKQDGQESESGAENTIPSVNFPDDLIEKMISFMPIKPAVALSLLSKRFKKSWRSSRHLCFDKEFARGQGQGARIKIINHILDLHSGNKIQKFSLYIDPIGYQGLIEDLIEKAMLKGVEELDLDFSKNRNVYFDVRPNIFDFEGMRVLRLNRCRLDLPPTFEGLRNLRALILEDIGQSISGLLDSLLSNCLLVERLELLNCEHYGLTVIAPNLKNFKVYFVKGIFRLSSISIDTPTLCSFNYYGEVCTIKFDSKMSQLNDVILNFTPSRFKCLSETKDFMTSLAFVNVLTVSGAFVEELSRMCKNLQLGEMPFFLWHLKELHLCGGRLSFINLFVIASFLKNCPSLESLFIDIRNYSAVNSVYWEHHGQQNFRRCEPAFESLKFIKLKGLTREVLVLEMLKFFLKKARSLETLVLISSEKSHRNYFETVCQFDQSFLPASPVARIEVYSYLDDKSSMYPTHMKNWRR